MKLNLYFLISFLLLLITSNAQDTVKQRGFASCYAEKFEGRITASGEIYDPLKLTAAHQKLNFGTFVKVTNVENNKSVIVVINDRGPYTGNRIIDLSKKAAYKIGLIESGITEVEIEIVESSNINIESLQENLSQDDDKTEGLYYKLMAKKTKPGGFGIQIASYAEIANLMHLADIINESIKKDLIIQVVHLNQNKIYRLIIGDFKTKEDANKFKITLKDDYPDAFIIQY